MERIAKLYELLKQLSANEFAFTIFEEHLNSYLVPNDREMFIAKVKEMQIDAKKTFRVGKYLDDLMNLL